MERLGNCSTQCSNALRSGPNTSLGLKASKSANQMIHSQLFDCRPLLHGDEFTNPEIFVLVR